MTTRYYSIDTGNGDNITTGIQMEIVARRVAQREANERGESVFLYASDAPEGADAVEIAPE